MTYNRPYTFELAYQLLTAQPGDDLVGHYANAASNGVDRPALDRAAQTLRRLAPADVNTWIRQEYIVDGWLHGYLDITADPADPTLTTWKLGQLADAHYRNAS
ncbi:hypothetical protein AB4Z39_33275 [Mycobacterium adipatum]|jgi:hypothetical protein|uniref:hypothetical protein n=1 Tax=Mycobacterium adipatum TaxID=1682113 RepID=UPI0034E0755D